MAHLAHYKQAHPLPMKVTHWVNLVCMALLIFTGFLIHFPFWAGLTGVARGVHVFCGMLLVVNCILRIIFAFMFHSAPTGGTRNMVRDYKTYLPQADNRHQLGAWSSITCSSRRITRCQLSWAFRKSSLIWLFAS